MVGRVLIFKGGTYLSGSRAVLIVRVRYYLSVLVYVGLSIVYRSRALPVTGCTCVYAYNLAILLHGGSSLRNLASLERELQNKHRHMVQTKLTPPHVDVRPPKCVIYITRNPVTFAIHWRREFHLQDQKA